MVLNLDSKIKLNNGVDIPILGLGTWLSKGNDAEQSVVWALEYGYRHIDTASFYGNEAQIGSGIKKSGIDRDEIFITTKLWTSDCGYDNALKSIDKSLDLLDLKYIDLYLIHWPVSGKRIDTWKAMEKILKDGKARSIGISNFNERHLVELLIGADEFPAINQFEITPYLFKKDLMGVCKSNKVQVEAYSPLTRAAKLNDGKLVKIATKYNKSTAQLLIRWGLQHGMISIPKSSNKDRILENSQVFDFEISEEDMLKLNNFHENYRVTDWDPDDPVMWH